MWRHVAHSGLIVLLCEVVTREGDLLLRHALFNVVTSSLMLKLINHTLLVSVVDEIMNQMRETGSFPVKYRMFGRGCTLNPV